MKMKNEKDFGQKVDGMREEENVRIWECIWSVRDEGVG